MIVYGLITVPNNLVFDIIEHPWFQRLRRIIQLGLTHYVYPSAVHTRYQHALGAMHLMTQAVEVAVKRDFNFCGRRRRCSLRYPAA